MKTLVNFMLCLGLCLNAQARGNPAIAELLLDEHTVYTIPVSLERITTISFPGPITAIDAAHVTSDTQTDALFQIAHTKGAAFFSVRALTRKATTNVNLRWNNKTYVLELVETNRAWFSVIFRLPPDKGSETQVVKVTPQRLLALLDKAKAYPLLKMYHPEAVAAVEVRTYAKEPKQVDYENYVIHLDEVFRFNPEDTLVFRVRLENKTDVPLTYIPDSFSVRIGERTYFPSITDASGIIPPKGALPAYFAVTGTPNGGRNELSLKNDFTVILQATKPSDEPES
jgi:hypothetical protein